MKKVFIVIVSLFIAFCPCMTLCNFSYADTNINPEWTFIQDAAYNMQKTFFVSSFKAFMNANSSYFRFSYDDQKAIVQWSYDTLDKVIRDNNLGSISDYYSNIAYGMDSDGNFKFWYTASGLRLMDDLYLALLDYYGIDTDNIEKNIYNGEWFEDINGNGCYIYELQGVSEGQAYNYNSYSNYVKKLGSSYIYNYDALLALYNNATNNGAKNGEFSLTFNPFDNFTFTRNFTCSPDDVNRKMYFYYNNSKTVFYGGNSTNNADVVVFKNVNSDVLYFGTHTIFNGNLLFQFQIMNSYSNASNYLTNQLIDLAKTGANIAMNTTGKQAIIDLGKLGADAATSAINHIKDPEEKKPDLEPSDPDPDDTPPPIDNPSNNPTYPTGVTQDPNGGFNFQMPNLNIDWNLDIDVNNLPFPFSIPNDIYNAFNTLNVQAEAPHFQGTVDLVVTEWDIDIDFTPYSSIANIVNKWFLFVYIVGLIIATRSLMHIY